ncbi:MAG TPA: PhoH family protein [Polyangiales bacterium]|jgi:phosphate starvation-inducible PhoH-like protein|nr:PhoH family protein [Polyangiales bacterium]
MRVRNPEAAVTLATGSSTGDDAVTADIEVVDADMLLQITGPSASRLARIEQATGASAGLRGHTIRLRGTREQVALAERALLEMQEITAAGGTVRDADVVAAVRLLAAHPELKLREVFQDTLITAQSGKPITARGLAQRYYLQAIRDNDVVFGIGPAGTGKTYLGMAMAIQALQTQRVKRIVLTRPAVEAGEKLGFLPGDMTEKVDPYLRPLYDALHDMLPAARANALIQRGVIEVAPLAFMRGRTLEDAFVILDEAQNTTVPQMKMFLTRIGPRSKAVVTGDPTQVDLPSGQPSGLADAMSLLEAINGLQFCFFGAEDVVRHPLVAEIVRAYESRDAARARDKGHGHGS